MKKIYRIFVLLIMMSLTMASKAQNDGIALTLLPHLSYNNYYNPAIPVESKFVFGVGVSNVGVSVFNSSVRYNNIFGFDANGLPNSIDANKFINSLDEHDNLINANLSMDVLRLGLRLGRLFIDFDCRLKFNAEAHYSRDFLGFFVNGNGNYLGHDNPADFSIGLDANLLTEVSVGLQYDVTKKLTVGVRPKVLLGVVNVSVNDDQTKIYTDPNTYAMTADVNINMQASSILKLDNINTIGDFGTLFEEVNFNNMFDFKQNIGYGIDFGASYTFNKHIGIAAGVYDLGFIKWDKSKEKHNHKDNVVVNDALIDDFEDLLEMKLDFDEMYLGIVEDIWDNDSLYDGPGYTTSLKTRIMLQGYFELMPMLRITAISQMCYIRNEYRPSFTLAYSGSFFRLLNVTASYTRSEYSGNTIGAGVSLNFGPLNVYVLTDNVMIFSKLDKTPMEMATSYGSANVRLGLVFTLGRVRR